LRLKKRLAPQGSPVLVPIAEAGQKGGVDPAIGTAMDALTALLTRHSISPAFMKPPAPSGEALTQILKAGAAAPDHGQLRPWRFILIREGARARLGELAADALAARQPETPADLLEKERGKPLRAPLIVAVAAAIQADHPKIPAVEQLLAAGAAVQNMLLAAHALGFAGKWVTGANAYEPGIKQALGLAEADALVGFVYLGTIDGAPPTVPHADAAPAVSDWTG
jgi:nitroreductase